MFIYFVLQQAEATAKRREKRAEVFVPPKEDAVPSVDEKRKRRRTSTDVGVREKNKKTKQK
jgi:ribosomal RNA assembly protein